MGSTAYEKKQKPKEEAKPKVEQEKSKKLKKIEELLGPLKDDKDFKEFVTANKAIKSVENIWKNDIDFADAETTTKDEEKKAPEETNIVEEKKSNGDEDADFENGRLFVRNLAYTCKEEDLESLFSKYKPLVECNMPIDSYSKQPKGFAYVGFMFPEHAIKAFNELDGTIFQGRMLHILPAKSKAEEEIDETKTLKQVKEDEKKKNSQKSYNWNALFVNQDALANLMSDKYNVNKSDLFDVSSKTSIAVRLAVGETQIVNDIRKFLTRNGVRLDSFNNMNERSKTTILVKNLPFKTKENELKVLFEKYGELKRVVLPDYGIAALVEFTERQDARQAFIKLAYRKFKNVPLYLEWAPVDVFDENFVKEVDDDEEKKKLEEREEKLSAKESPENEVEEDDGTMPEPESTLFVKNLNFTTVEADLIQVFKKIGKCKATVAKKISNNKEVLSMGYGFVEFKTKAKALEAIKKLQNHVLDGHKLELVLSNKQLSAQSEDNKRKLTKNGDLEGKTPKIMVRNVPFETKVKELEELFKVFGQLKYVRLPKKIDGTHRGFGFVEFVTVHDAKVFSIIFYFKFSKIKFYFAFKRAFDSLCHSTHLFGRRLVLEWASVEQTQDVEILRLKEAQLSGK